MTEILLKFSKKYIDKIIFNGIIMITDTDKISEKELIKSVSEGSDAAFSELAGKYEMLLSSMAEKYARIIADSEADDLRQEARMALYRAAVKYDLSQDKVTFGLYAKICIRNRMISILRRSRSSFKRRYGGIRKSETVHSRAVDTTRLKELADSVLTEYEKTVFSMYLDGKPYGEISDAVGKPVKSVDNALFRAKRKLRNGYDM